MPAWSFKIKKQSKTKVVALIPARAGSKRLPKKNLKSINRKPLIFYSIEFAKQIQNITQIYVTTNDPKIAKIANKLGVSVPELRPENLSTDSTPMYQVLRYFENKFLSKIDYDYLILLDPTSPVRVIDDLNKSIRFLNQNKKFDGVVSISKPYFNPFWVGVSKSKTNIIEPIIRKKNTPSLSQKAPVFFRINGNFYIWRSKKVRNIDNDYLKKMQIYGYEIDELRAFSIDTPAEFEILKCYLKYGLIKLPNRVVQ
jgi:CMP-N,N'-diacetyllegionaminic acid synthase